MKFKVQTKELVAAISRVQAVTENNIVTITAGKKGLRVGSQGKTTMLTIRVAAEVETPGSMSIESYMFSQSIKNRAEVTVKLADSQVIVTGKSMNLKLVTVPTEEVTAVDKKDGNGIDAETQAAFAECVKLATINKVHDENPIGIRVQLGKKGIRVVMADEHRVAVAHNTAVKVKQSLQFMLDAKSFDTIAALAGKNTYSLAFTEAEVLAWNTDFELRIPTIVEAKITDEAVNSLVAKLLAWKPKTKATVLVKEWGEAIDTMNGIFEAGANLKLTSGDASLEVKFVTSYGESTISVKAKNVKGKFKHQVDLPLTIDTFAQVRDKTLDLVVYEDQMLFVQERINDINCLYSMTMVTG